MRLWIAPRVSSVTERHSSGNSMARDSGQGAMSAPCLPAAGSASEAFYP